MQAHFIFYVKDQERSMRWRPMRVKSVRSWRAIGGHAVAYSLDPDGHVLAFAEAGIVFAHFA